MFLPRLDGKLTSLLMIIIGIICLAFPTVPIATMGLILGIIVLLVALGLLIKGILELAISRALSITSIIIAILLFIFSYELIFNTGMVNTLISIILYIFGMIVLLIGIIALISGIYFKPFSALGLSTILFALLTFIFIVFIQNPVFLGVLIGIWLIVSGILSLLTDKQKSYIDI